MTALGAIGRRPVRLSKIKASSISITARLVSRLIRKNGIIEHQVVCGGTNTVDASWGEAYRQQFEPATQASYHNARVDGAVTLPTWYAAGKDEIEKDDNGRYSLSVLSGNGATTADWYNNVKLTPGEINIGQTIDGTPPAPAGNYVIVSAQIDDASKPNLEPVRPAHRRIHHR